MQAVLNSCYGYISQSNGYGGYLHMLLSWHTPTMQLQNRNSTYMVELATMNVAVDNSTADYVYDGAYQTINTVNDLLMNIGLCSGMSEAEHNRIEGEARLLRALSYFNLVRIFGALPYIDRPAASIEESHKPRTSIDRIYGLIIGDLEQAWNMLPEKGAHAHGRPHKWAAKAFLAKVYVALACIKEHPGEPFDAALFDKSAKEYWQLAYDNAKEVYDSHAYSLVPNFADLWVYTNKHTEESILEMEMNYVTGSCPFMYRYLPGYWEGVPLTNSSNNYGQIRPSRERGTSTTTVIRATGAKSAPTSTTNTNATRRSRTKTTGASSTTSIPIPRRTIPTSLLRNTSISPTCANGSIRPSRRATPT